MILTIFPTGKDVQCFPILYCATEIEPESKEPCLFFTTTTLEDGYYFLDEIDEFIVEVSHD